MKKITMSVLSIFCFIAFIVGCTTTATNKDVIQTGVVKIQKNKVIYVIKSDDGSFDGKVYNGSGVAITNMFSVNLRPYASNVIIASSKNSWQEYVSDAKKNNAYYIIKPTIMHWEPRAAAWSGVPTRSEINVSVYDVAAAKEVINRTIAIKGRAMTFSNQSAEKLSDGIIKKFCEDIF
ncbi:DUF4823 domain-containing protein [Endomicrobium proavitum]|uniref:Lipoprotein n=1 Tax=Endomicrobium proavitum TaxID=1408281 RepID=A0A0G3WK98_9BACT|nr:DUF4823 domain-containing protein [Endomicrobium proavitum]AKL98325.1 exported protein of unknown function [Endomicrobium proavitum]